MADILPLLLDFSQPFNVTLLETTITTFYQSHNAEQRTAAQQVLQAFQEHPQAWTRVDAILETAKVQDTKFFALQILEGVIKTKWAALPPEQREGIKNYASNLIIKYSTDEALYRREDTFVRKLNVILVQILKQDWPTKWPTFIPDLVAASKTNETLCENSMVILKLLSEEVFDFSRGELTQGKTKQLKTSLNEEFKLIHELCTFVLTNTRKAELIRATLVALNAYLSWVPLGYIFQSNMVALLLDLFPQAPFRNVALQCLTEVGSLNLGDTYAPQFAMFYRMFCQRLITLVNPDMDLRSAYDSGTEDQQVFVQNLSLFFTQFFKAHLHSLEKDAESQQNLVWGLEILIAISYVDDTEVFKTCLDYWNMFAADIFSVACQAGLPVAGQPLLAGQPVAAANGPPLEPGQQNALTQAQLKTQLYERVLHKMRALMITKMAKPEEVIVVEDDNGNIVRETMKDNDVLMQYKTMREVLVYLSHLNQVDTETLMLDRLREQMQGTWTWNGLNTLCWAIGSISGSFSEEAENRFLVTIIRDLLNLCENTRGKDNKAVIASNIMYVVGQYPKFLRAHWKFLKTVVNKLFEFMHETHPGVQDMACDTFLKISNKCKRKFVIVQPQETQAFIAELLEGLTGTIQDLQPHQIHSFYESVGLMIGAEPAPDAREQYLIALMAPPNSIWDSIIQQAMVNPDVLKQQEVIKSLQNVLQTNASVCLSLGHPYTSQMGRILDQMLQLYRMYSDMVSKTILEGGPHAARSSFVKYMCGVKKNVLRLLEMFVDKCEDLDLLAQRLVPALIDPILGDYARSVPDARDSEVLSLFAAIINKLKARMEPMVPEVFKSVFTSTLEMITKNFEDYPDHRLRFFALLHAATNHCFSSIGQMSADQIKLVIDSIVWAFRHTERNVADTGLQLLADMLANFSRTADGGTAFYQAYYLHLMREVFAVMTDTFHTPGFKLHCRILQHLFAIVRTNQIQAPLWDPSAGTQYPTNALFVRDFASNLLRTSFPNMMAEQVAAAVTGMLELEEHRMFKHHMRDFLVQTKMFGSKESADLFAEETQAKLEEQRKQVAAIPGMVSPALQPGGDDMGDA